MCIIDRIGSGRSDPRRKLRHCGPARYKKFNGVDLCVNHGDTLRECLASLSEGRKEGRNEGRKIERKEGEN